MPTQTVQASKFVNDSGAQQPSMEMALMTWTCLSMTLVLLAGACASKSLDGGANDRDASTMSKEDGGANEGGPVGTRKAGENCDDANGCVEGLSCRDFAVQPPGQPCRVVGQQCTKACARGTEGDAICQTLGPKYMCFGGCGDDFSCGATP